MKNRCETCTKPINEKKMFVMLGDKYFCSYNCCRIYEIKNYGDSTDNRKKKV